MAKTKFLTEGFSFRKDTIRRTYVRRIFLFVFHNGLELFFAVLPGVEAVVHAFFRHELGVAAANSKKSAPSKKSLFEGALFVL